MPSSAALTAAQSETLGRLVAVYPEADELGRRFSSAGHELYLVGGTVRDTLLDRAAETIDLDFATSARPEETEALLRGWGDAVWLTGARFGTVSASKGGRRLEITTFRADVYSAGSRHPEVTYGPDIESDLSRRDFTVNAMAVRVPEHRFVDPHGGLGDLRAGVLRTPVAPERSFADDPLRMVRLARFVAVLGAAPAPETAAAAAAMASELDTISAERIRDELDKLIVAEHQAAGMNILVQTGLCDRFLPEVPALRMASDPLHHHKDVYAHTLAVVDGCPRDDAVLRLAALLHDIGKPATRRFHRGGKVSFHHHEEVGARLTRARLEALRYSGEVVTEVTELVRLHLRFHGYANGEWTDSAVRRYARDAGTSERLRRLNLLTRADVTTRNAAKRARLRAAMDDLEARIERLEAEEALSALRPPIDGDEIMRHLGLPPGPLIGQARTLLLDALIERGPYAPGEAYALLDEWWATHQVAGGNSQDGG